MPNTNILLTGANGFIGTALLRTLRQRGDAVRALARRPAAADILPMPALEAGADWRAVLQDSQVVVHTAARAHRIAEQAADAAILSAFHAVNTTGTLHLAKQAAACGVARFVFLSTIGVNGSVSEQPLTEQDAARPDTPYAESKWAAEQGLWQIAEQTGMEIVIIRPPLVYGPQAPGNFGRLARAVERGWPLPLASIVGNRRTMIGLDNLVDLIVTTLDHPAAANQLFLAGDDESLSTADLLQRMGRVLGKKSPCFPFPPRWLDVCLRQLGRESMAKGLCRSLEINNAKAKAQLGWRPHLTVDQGLALAMQGQRE